MADAESLRRLGGGRWETKDGRFRIEPQSGTWMVIDAQETDDLGLPLTRGPFRSLNAARDAIGAARDQGPTTSPLAEMVEAAKARPASTARAKQPSSTARAPRAEAREPAWFAGLDEGQRRLARRLLRRLEGAGVSDAANVARAELVEDRPALAKLAIERRLAALVATDDDTESIASAIVECLADGEDHSLGVRWRLTDAAGRPIRRLSLKPQAARSSPARGQSGTRRSRTTKKPSPSK
jgi:hypothetical protein